MQSLGGACINIVAGKCIILQGGYLTSVDWTDNQNGNNYRLSCHGAGRTECCSADGLDQLC